MNTIQLRNNTTNTLEFQTITFDDATNGFLLAQNETKVVLNSIAEFWRNDYFSIYNELNNLLTSGELTVILDGYELPKERSLDVFKGEIVNLAYKPTFKVISVNSTLVPANTNGYEVLINGEFLDFVASVEVKGSASGNIPYTALNKSYGSISLNINTTAIETITISLVSVAHSEVITINTAAIDIYSPSDSGIGHELWVKSGSNNGAIVGNGTFEAENSNGDGWNEHAYFGSFTSSVRIDFEMTIYRLDGVSNAYCYVRFTNSNAVSTSGNPRIYAYNGQSLLIYNASGGSGSTTINEGDKISVSFTPTTMTVYKNGVEVYTDVGTYSLSNIYPTFTGFRVFRAKDILIKVYQ